MGRNYWSGNRQVAEAVEAVSRLARAGHQAEAVGHPAVVAVVFLEAEVVLEAGGVVGVGKK